MNKKITILCLFLIITLGFVIRFYKLGEAPKGLYIDEAGQGYSAYSILKTGKDEFGKPFPAVFRSFTDFKTPVYVYLIVPLIPLFGLTSFTVRLPSFIFSILTFPLFFLLLRSLFKDDKKSITFSLFSTLMLAISPWHTLFGRTNFECNVALFFFLLGIYLFYLGLKKPFYITLSLIIFAISLPAYHSERIITPITVLVLLFRYKMTVFTKSYLNYFIAGLVVAFIITLPTLMVATTPGFMARASGLNIFSHNRQLPSGNIERYSGIASPLVNGSWYLSTYEFFSLYFSYFSPRNMFYLGDYGPRSSFPNLGTFYVWQFPLYFAGLYFLVKRKELKELRFLTIFLLLITPIPAAVTRDPYSSIRALPMVIPQTIIISLGFFELMNFLRPKLKKAAFFVLCILIIHSILNLYSSAIVLNEFLRGQEWDFGLSEVADFVKNNSNSLPVIFDNSRDEPYIQMAFFLQEDPVKFQNENFEVPISEYYTNMSRNKEKKIENITTRAINWKEDLKKNQYLVGDELAISYKQIDEHKLKLVKEIRYPDFSVAFRIVKTNPDYELNQK